MTNRERFQLFLHTLRRVLPDVRTQRELFVSNAAASSVVRYLDSRNREFERDVLPNTTQAGYVQAEIRKVFKSYLSKHVPSMVI